MKIVFYCKVDPNALKTVGFYKQNIEVLRSISNDVIICTKYSEIPKKYDLMFVYWWTYALYPVLHAKLRNRPVIITGAYNFELPKYEGAVDYLNRPLYQRFLIASATKLATLNLVNSNFEKEQIEKHFGISNCDISYLSYSSDLIIPAKTPPSNRLKLLEEQGILKQFVFNICWLEESNLIRKGVLELIKAFSQCSKELDKKNYLICAGRIGNGKEMFNKEVVNSQVEDKVIHIGEISEEEKRYLLQQCAIYAQPSRYEGFGLATLEAVVCGAKVIATDVGAVKEVVGNCGVYVDINEPDSLRLALKNILTNMENDNGNSTSSQLEMIRNKFSESQFKEKLVNYITRVKDKYV